MRCAFRNFPVARVEVEVIAPDGPSGHFGAFFFGQHFHFFKSGLFFVGEYCAVDRHGVALEVVDFFDGGRQGSVVVRHEIARLQGSGGVIRDGYVKFVVDAAVIGRRRGISDRPADVGVLCAVVEGDGDCSRDIAGIDGGAALHSRNAAYVHRGTVCGDGNFGVHAAIVEGDLVFARYAARVHRTSVYF